MTSEEEQQEFKHNLRNIGIVLLVLSGLTIILTIASLVVNNYYWAPLTNVGIGIWGSLFIIANGILLITHSSLRSFCVVPWMFGGSVFCGVVSLTTVCLEVGAGLQDSNAYERNILHLIIFIVTTPQFVLCLYLSVVFGRMTCSEKYRFTWDESCPTSPCCYPHASRYPTVRYGAVPSSSGVQVI